MKIFSNKQLTPSQQVNNLGKYLRKNIDTCYKYEKSSNMYDVYFTILYEIPLDIRKAYDLDSSYDDLNEMNLDLNLTTYSNKIRINILEVNNNFVPLGSKVFDPLKYSSYADMRSDIFMYLEKTLIRKYDGYDFIM